VSAPKEKSGTGSALEESAPNLTRIVCHWQDHLGWMMREYYRTGSAKHLQAAGVHQRAMTQQRLNGRKRQTKRAHRKGGAR
jgi:hypothetical protein